MIVKWKRVSALEYTACWNEHVLLLTWEPQQSKWQVRVDGMRCKQQYTSAPSAIDHVEEIVNRQIVSLSAVVHAVQRPLSGSRMVRHA